ncbi:hypothetical protein EXIGLDRAFT_494409 [Exidia glandulosa HHB12029]|uniref:Uncharacterized protein n=1 Tax=Exidia glandulosa HHB12029 TaxID=1314781 RepID=A0A165JJM1_EXIGL|nr:hypothetical protein EXIGLDRAFT_494409 [Exidia glandulosa HHB12029]
MVFPANERLREAPRGGTCGTAEPLSGSYAGEPRIVDCDPAFTAHKAMKLFVQPYTLGPTMQAGAEGEVAASRHAAMDRDVAEPARYGEMYPKSESASSARDMAGQDLRWTSVSSFQLNPNAVAFTPGARRDGDTTSSANTPASDAPPVVVEIAAKETERIPLLANEGRNPGPKRKPWSRLWNEKFGKENAPPVVEA